MRDLNSMNLTVICDRLKDNIIEKINYIHTKKCSVVDVEIDSGENLATNKSEDCIDNAILQDQIFNCPDLLVILNSNPILNGYTYHKLPRKLEIVNSIVYLTAISSLYYCTTRDG